MTDVKLDDLAADFARHMKYERNLSDATIKQYDRDLRRWMQFLTDNGVPLDTDHVEVSHLRRYVQYLSEERELSPASVRTRFACLRSFYKFCRQYHDVESNPAAAVASPNVPHRLPEVLTDSDVARMIQACDESYFGLYRVRDRAVLAVLCTLGLRRQELMDIRIEDWDAGEKRLRVRSGKGDKERVLPLTDELISLGERWLEMRPTTDEPWFFVSRQGTKLGPMPIQRMIRRIAKAAGLEKNVHCHMFRHYAATAIVQNNASGGMEQARRILGHASTDSLSVYLHLNVDDLRPAVQDNARRTGIRTRTTVEAEGIKVDPGTELAAGSLQRLLDQLPDDWQTDQNIVEWLAVEWTRHLVADEVPFAADDVRAILTERTTVEGLTLDEHLTISEVGALIARHLRSHGHGVEEVLALGQEMNRDSLGRSPNGDGVSAIELRELNGLMPKDDAVLSTIAGVVAIASQLQLRRVDIPCGRQSIEMILGLLMWDRGLPPLIIPASSRNLWRLLLDRASAGDTVPCVAWCVSRGAEVVGEMTTV